MDFELDPQVRDAVEHPERTVRGPEELQLKVRLAGEPARRALAAHWAEAGPGPAAPDVLPETPGQAPPDAAGQGAPGTAQDPARDPDRLAAAVLLATLFDDTALLERAARAPGDFPGAPSAPPEALLGFTGVPGARAALAPVLERPLLTGLLEWATHPVPDRPPIALAEAARDLGIDDDDRVYREVRRRVRRMLAREHDGSEPLERFSAVLEEAERRPREPGPALSGEEDDDPAGLKNWGILGLVIVGIILLLVLLL
ncbi:hypothetical protein AS188_01895 [Kocuria flava]|uniref:Uncharacterized protein n=1 Tax=Kocuria flava TaxID=446860 RepID=A0A0U3H764_9MICC|nr:hypothetical protein [Kocuria flava]ALU38709.1 hypothetical protein AS188_01895 [Kocuria flava]